MVLKSDVENQTGLKIKKLRRSNRENEYCHKKCADFLEQNGTIHETTVPYTPEQNGVKDRVNRTLIEKTRCLLQDSGLNNQFWGKP